MKYILLTTAIALCALGSNSCKKKPEPKPYYFRFQADGVDYDYEYGCETTFVGSACNLAGFQSTSTAWGGTYQIYGHNMTDPTARGEVRFFLNKDDFNTLDTIVLDGVRNTVYIDYLQTSNGIYGFELFPPLYGQIIIFERTENYLKGIFKMDVYQYSFNDEGVTEITDTILHVTSGEFMVPQ